jgi:hypothetical protein
VRLCALVLLVVALPAQAQLYKCVDEHGRTRYSDQKGAGCKETDIRGSPPIGGRLQAPETDLAREEAEFRRRQNERATQEEKDRQQLAQRCARLRQEYAVFSSGRRIMRINDTGEREYVEDATREQRLAQLQQDLRACP